MHSLSVIFKNIKLTKCKIYKLNKSTTFDKQLRRRTNQTITTTTTTQIYLIAYNMFLESLFNLSDFVVGQTLVRISLSTSQANVNNNCKQY